MGAPKSGSYMYSFNRSGSVVFRVRAVLLLAMLLGGSNAALSQQPAPQPPAIAPGLQLLLSRIKPGQTLDRYLENLRIDFFRIDADADGRLTQRDVDHHEMMRVIQERANAMLVVMRYDLDGDGAVTEDEIRRAMKYDLRSELAQAAVNLTGKPPAPTAEALAKQIESNVRSIMALDSDNDGKVVSSDAPKLFQRTPRSAAVSQYGESGRARQALTLDTSSKGEVTLADYQGAGEALFRKIDADNDGTISQQELADYGLRPDSPDAAVRNAAAEAAQKRLNEQADAVRKKQEEAEAVRTACAMPAPSEKAKVVLLSASRTDALSSVTLGSQDVVVHAGRVVVERGREPLYLVIPTSSATIWQFSGAIERIERVVMTSSEVVPKTGNAQQTNAPQPPLAGATGIAAERISFFARRDCLRNFSEIPSSSSIEAIAAIRNAIGKEPDAVAFKHYVSSFAVPSGKIDMPGDELQQPLIMQKQFGSGRARDEMYKFFRGGVIDIDPKTVVASAPAAAYEVLPAQAGLAQLLTAGAVTRNVAGEYVVRQKIRFPPGLFGAHAVVFLVMKGTPYPDGDPAHSCVVMEETGERKGALCPSR
jgi:Ca2+-binding EF-hand superfamily protein